MPENPYAPPSAEVMLAPAEPSVPDAISAAKLASWFFLGSAVASPFVGTLAVWIGEESGWLIFGEVVAGWIFTAVGTLEVRIVGALLRKRLMPTQKAKPVAIGWGIAYSILSHFLAQMVETMAPNSVGAAALEWIYLLGFPLMLYWPVCHWLLEVEVANSCSGVARP